jgi:Protein of unknown function (DUF3016)
MRREAMRTQTVLVGCCLLYFATAAAAPGGVMVTFINPEHYTDAGRHGRDTERNLRTLQSDLENLGARCLAVGETLDIQVLDVDLAGREEWWHRTGGDLRVMRDITWPRLVLHYVQRDATGAELRQDHERVLDMNYLWRSAYVRFDSRPLPYERVMLHD